MAEANYESYMRAVEELKSAFDRNDTAASERINNFISETEAKFRTLEAAANRNSVNDVEQKHNVEAKAAFKSYLRLNSTTALQALESKAATATQADGTGYVTVPTFLASQMRKTLVDQSVMRQLATVESVNGPNWQFPFATGGTNCVWVGEKDARNATDVDNITEISPSFGELWARPLATQQLLEDSAYDIEGFIAARTVEAMSAQEGAAFFTGNGTKKPTGILTPTIAATADATRTFGTVQYVPSKVAANLFDATNNGVDVLIDLVQSLKAGYRAGACFIVNKATLGVLRKLKDQYGQYLWQPSMVAGMPSTLLDYPVYEDENMPSIAAGALPIIFGDIKQSYLIADRVDFQIQRDNLTQQPYVGWNVRKRVGGSPLNTEAYKLLKIAAS